jgi:uncharacterized membrane protein
MTFSELTAAAPENLANILHIGDAAMGAEPYAQAVAALEGTPLVVGLDALSVIIATIIGYIGVSVMIYGCLRALYDFLIHTGKGEHRLPMIRINLGKHLALGLEFLVGKDIVESLVHPTWDDLGKLAVIIGIRTVVTIFLSRELKEVEQEINVERKELDLERKRARMGKR